jgi:Glycosyltransferase family 87
LRWWRLRRRCQADARRYRRQGAGNDEGRDRWRPYDYDGLNTDPVFVMLSLLSAWLLADRGRPGWSGACFAAALSVKIIPMVILPAALIVAARRRGLRSFVIGAASRLEPRARPAGPVASGAPTG